MKHNRNTSKTSTRRPRIITFVAALIVAAGAAAYFVLNKPEVTASPEDAPAALRATSLFSFDAAAAPGWRIGPGNETSLAAFKNDADCFISIDMQPEKIDEATWLANLQTGFARDPSITFTPGEVLPLALQSSTGPRQFQLHPYTAVGGDAYGGQAYGYVAHPDGYLRLQAYCDPAEAELLPSVVPALKALTFDASK